MKGLNKTKFHFFKPRCAGHECYVDNRQSNKEMRVRGRVLFPGARYCIHGKKIRRFSTSDAQYSVPHWCPKLHHGYFIRVYVKAPESYFDYLLSRDDGKDTEPVIMARCYILRTTAQTYCTPLQFVKKLTSGFCDYMDLMGYNPQRYDVVEIDNGITNAYLYLNKDYEWRQLPYFDKERCDDGSVGSFKLRPHGNQQYDRFFLTTEEHEQSCIGYMRGYFTEGRFVGHWLDKHPELAGPGMWAEYEALLEALKTYGFLRGADKMYDYCRRFPDGAFPDSAQGYGYKADTEAHSFYIRCLPGAEDYNAYICVYCFS